MDDNAQSVWEKLLTLPPNSKQYILRCVEELIHRVTSPTIPDLPPDIWSIILSFSLLVTPGDFSPLGLVCTGWKNTIPNAVRILRISPKCANPDGVYLLFPFITTLTSYCTPHRDVRLPNLTTLVISSQGYESSFVPGSSGLVGISLLTNLTRLNLRRSCSSSEGKYLRPLTRLERLTLTNSGPSWIPALFPLNIKKLTLIFPIRKILDEGTEMLTSLHVLKIIGCNVSINGSHIRKIPNLRKVVTNEPKIMDEVGRGKYLYHELLPSGRYEYYEGEWEGGWPHGQGKMVTKDGIEEGLWEGGVLVTTGETDSDS